MIVKTGQHLLDDPDGWTLPTSRGPRLPLMVIWRSFFIQCVGVVLLKLALAWVVNASGTHHRYSSELSAPVSRNRLCGEGTPVGRSLGRRRRHHGKSHARNRRSVPKTNGGAAASCDMSRVYVESRKDDSQLTQRSREAGPSPDLVLNSTSYVEDLVVYPTHGRKGLARSDRSAACSECASLAGVREV